MSLPLISVITPTWLRAGQGLGRCLESVSAQKYARWEHIIVSDGPDAEFMAASRLWADKRRKFAALPEHTGRTRWGVEARLHGLSLAQGEVVAWLDDDNAYRPHHLDSLYWKMHLEESSWGYSQCWFSRYGEGGGYIIGSLPPACGNLDTSAMMNRRSLHEVATWRDDGQQTIDWDLAEHWIAAGHGPAFLPDITVDYYIKPLGRPGMPRWQLIAEGQVDDHEKLTAVMEAAAAALRPHGLLSSQFNSELHNGPLPEPRPAKATAKGKPAGSTGDA